MPPKSKSKSGAVQTTLSKFFTAASNSKSYKTDDQEDFEVIDIKQSKKRPVSKTDKLNDEHALSNKKMCLQSESKESPLSTYKAASETQVSTAGCSKARDHTANKLRQFELPQENEKEDVGEKSVFSSKNCVMIEFDEQESNNDVNGNQVCMVDDERDYEPNVSSLSSFATNKGSNSKSESDKKGAFGKMMKTNSKHIKFTPLEQQVVDIKAERPDALLCVECGYRYRFFGDDAEVAAKVLKIYCHMDHNFMTASIPTHRLFVHVRRLVAAGYKVGVVKQTETAHLKAAGDNKGGPFTRKLTAMYTKSTLIGQAKAVDDDVSDTDVDTKLRMNQHLLCIYEQPNDVSSGNQLLGIMCVDPATGDIVHDDFNDGSIFAELETRISHLRPVEIIVSGKASVGLLNFVRKIADLSPTDEDKIRVETLPHEYFTEAMETVKDFYKDAASLGIVHNLPKPTLCCLAALCLYLRDFQLDSVLKLTSSFNKFSEQSRFMHLGSHCLYNLEVFQNSCDGSEKGSLFWMLDNTRTKFGSRLLRKWLNRPLLNYVDIKGRLDGVEELLLQNNVGLKTLAEMMGKLPDLERGLCSIFHQKCSPIEFCNVTNALERVCKAVKGVAESVSSALLQTSLNGIYECLTGVENFSKSISNKAAKENDMPNLFVEGLKDEEVAPIYETKAKISAVLAEILDHRKEVRLALRQPGLTYTTVLQTEFLIEVKNNLLKAVPSDWTQISSTKAVTRFHTPFIFEKYRTLGVLREQLQKDAEEAWKIFLRTFSSNFVTYKTAVTHLATLDCLMSLAHVASQHSYCKPKFMTDKVHIKINQGRHPIIEALSNGQDQYVPNDTDLSNDTGPRVMTVSGPNMGGKSSYIRQVALIAIMAQIGSYVPAESASLGIFDAIYTRMGASDDIFKGRSTFMVELQEASDIMARASHKALVILDELGRGTSTHDGVAIAHATLKHFITKCNCLVMFVTHFPMMSEFEALYPEVVRNFHMSFLLGNEESEEEIEELTFLYQLTEGAAAKSYGLNVARLAQVPGHILQVASKKSQTLENSITDNRCKMKEFVDLFKAEPSTILQSKMDDKN